MEINADFLPKNKDEEMKKARIFFYAAPVFCFICLFCIFGDVNGKRIKNWTVFRL